MFAKKIVPFSRVLTFDTKGGRGSFSNFGHYDPFQISHSLYIHVDYTLFKFYGKIFVGDVTVTVTVVPNKIRKLALIWKSLYETGLETGHKPRYKKVRTTFVLFCGPPENRPKYDGKPPKTAENRPKDD